MPERPGIPGAELKGRGARSSPEGRFSKRSLELDPEESQLRADMAPGTVLRPIQARTIVSHNQSPDVPFDHSINPYLGCEHGCIYCYARPSHSYLDLSPGLDFETQIFYKPDAPARLREAWEKPGYVCEPITIGANTDPYQPAEKTTGLTRSLLELFLEHRHPVSLITKGTLIERDIDILVELASLALCSVAISVPTMDDELKRLMEPRVPAASARLRTIGRLAAAGVPVSALVAPVIPAINDNEIEAIIEAVASAGAHQAAYMLLRLPHEVKDLFAEWLESHFPDRAAKVLNLVREAHGGRDSDTRFGRRHTGQGPYAELLGKRFSGACKRFGLQQGEYARTLDCDAFRAPGQHQLGLDL